MSEIITIRQHISESIRLAGEHLIKHVFPIYKVGKNKRPDFEGSGFSLIVDGDVYLITAAHVFQAIKETESSMYVGIGNVVHGIPRAPVYRTINPEPERSCRRLRDTY